MTTANWGGGDAAIGYGQGFVSTELDDMQGNYSTLYLRKTFEVADPGRNRFASPAGAGQ